MSAAVLCPCFTCTLEIAPIRDTARALERAGAAVLRFDYEGSGDSEGRFEAATVASEASDTVDAARFLLERVPLARVHLVGHSMGGGVALVAALELGSLVASVTTVATDPRRDAFERIFGADEVARARATGLVVVDTGFGRYPLARPLLDEVAASDFLGLARQLRVAGVPLLHVHGRTDLIVPLVEVAPIAAAQGVTLEVIEGGDHLFADRASRATLAERIARFIREAEARRRA